MEPIILHSDMNNFYASVEMLYNPALRDKPIAVAGDEETRHGIVLAKNVRAKTCGVRTGQVLWEARQQCPGLVCVPAHYDRYLRFSALAREIYISYTDQVEAFGLDECWLDVTGSTGLFGDGVTSMWGLLQQESWRSSASTPSVRWLRPTLTFSTLCWGKTALCFTALPTDRTVPGFAGIIPCRL